METTRWEKKGVYKYIIAWGSRTPGLSKNKGDCGEGEAEIMWTIPGKQLCCNLKMRHRGEMCRRERRKREGEV